MATSMQHVARLQSRLKTLLSMSMNIQKHTRVFPYCLQHGCFITSNVDVSFQSSRPFVTGHKDWTHGNVEPLRDRAPVKKTTKVLPPYKETVTSDTLTLILPEVAKGTTIDELNKFFSEFGTVESVTVEEKPIIAHVLMKNINDAVKLVKMKETNFQDRVIRFSKSKEANEEDVLSRTVVINNLNPLTEVKDLTFLEAFEIEGCRLIQEDLDSGYMRFQTPEEAEMFIMLSQGHPDFEIRGKNIQFNIKPEFPNLVYVKNLDKKTSAEELLSACRNFVPSNQIPECWRPQLLKGLVRIKFSNKSDAQLFFEEKANTLQFRNQQLHVQIQETKMLAVHVEDTLEPEQHHHHKFSYEKVGLTYSSRVLVQPGENTDLYIEAEGNSFETARDKAVNEAKWFWKEIHEGQKSLDDITEDDLKEIFSNACKIKVSVEDEGHRVGHVMFIGQKEDNQQAKELKN